MTERGHGATAFDPQRALETDQILVGRNDTRRAYNTRLRERRGFDDPLPLAGDKLVCLRNNRRKGLFNGGLWNVAERPTTRRQILKLRLMPDEGFAGKGVKVSVRPECFTGEDRGARLAACARNTTSSISAMC